jgi:hypothetical protein
VCCRTIGSRPTFATTNHNYITHEVSLGMLGDAIVRRLLRVAILLRRHLLLLFCIVGFLLVLLFILLPQSQTLEEHVVVVLLLFQGASVLHHAVLQLPYLHF